ncbi:hypothetical protein SESBI_04681 [Sesbania bispinosa]|nr:hypothetical protein SESBI_04681 [Sesbania bispinosa]
MDTCGKAVTGATSSCWYVELDGAVAKNVCCGGRGVSTVTNNVYCGVDWWHGPTAAGLWSLTTTATRTSTNRRTTAAHK